MRLHRIALSVGLLLLLTSCDFISTAYEETFRTEGDTEEGLSPDSTASTGAVGAAEEVTPETVPVNILKDARKLDDIQEKLQAMFPGKPVSICPPHIYFNTDRIRVQVVDPDVPENVDWYHYDAETDRWEKKDPVKTSARIVRKPIPLTAVKFSTANSVYRQIAEKAAEIEGADTPTSLYFSFNTAKWNWNARIEGSRADYTFTADKDGRPTAFKKQ